MSITYQPHRKKRRRTHGFLKRSRTPAGRRVLRNRRRKGRQRVSV
ncbi:MAG: 50S ribosomal protein L34 [Parcubacteria group bacterium]|nr:50S ribosomal protein L34 [Parcubacteria group bacterium]